MAVELPEGRRVAGTISGLGTVATETEDGSVSVAMAVTLADPASVELDVTPVDVHLERAAARGVLAVPVAALLALAEGGYAVERVDGSATELVGVGLGTIADGFVEIIGEVAAGDRVVVP